MVSIDWPQIYQESITHLQNLIRINTTNPPGHEMEAVKYLATILQKEGIPFQIFEPITGRANLVASLPGNGSKKPLLLSSHLDVVEAIEKHWEHPPFSGVIKDDFLWGRGALDMKHMTVYGLMSLLLCKRFNIKLNRNLIFLAVCDEEEGCVYGSEWMVKNKPELIRSEYALNEVGGFSLYVDGHHFFPIGVAEKGLCWFRITTHGESGHGSLPHGRQAIMRLISSVAKLNHHFHPHHVSKTTAYFIDSLASALKVPKGFILKLLKNKKLAPFFLKKMPNQKQAMGFAALLHDTVTPTKLSAGHEATVEFDGRIIPGHTVSDFLNQVKNIVGNDVAIEILRSWDPTEFNFKDPFFDGIVEQVKKQVPGAIAVPYLCPGFTDSTFYKQLGITCFGFAPVVLPPELNFSDLFHGSNERIPIKGFQQGLNMLWNVVSQS